MMEITITIDDVLWPQCSCGRFCVRCMDDEQGEESDGAYDGRGNDTDYCADGKRNCGGRGPEKEKSGCNEGEADVLYIKRLYPGKMSRAGDDKRNAEDPEGSVEDRDNDAADIFVFEEMPADWKDILCRYILYSAEGRSAVSEKHA